MKDANPVAGAQHMEIDYRELDDLIEVEFDNDKENLIMILQAIQRRYNHLPRTVLTYLSQKIGIPLSEIYGVGTFYSTFSLDPGGRNFISVCLGTACHVRGSESVREKIEETLNLGNGETTEDKRFTLESVRCIGCCAHGPVVKINEDIHLINSEQVRETLDKYE